MRRRRPLLHVEVLESRLCLSGPSLAQNVPLPPGDFGGPFVASPVVADLDGDGTDEALVAAGGGKLEALKFDPQSGRYILWRAFQVTGANSVGISGNVLATPVVVTLPGGRKGIFAGLGKDIGGASSLGDGRVFAWYADTAQVIPGWPREGLANYESAVPTANGLLPARNVAGPLASGDLDGDGVPEIVVTSINHMVTAYHLDGSVMWQYDASDSIESGAVIGDMDRDGIPEVVFGSDSSANGIFNAGGFVNVLDGRTGTAKDRIPIAEGIWSSPVLADINNDHNLEILVGTGLSFSLTDSTDPNDPIHAAADQVRAFGYVGDRLTLLWSYATTTDHTGFGHQVVGAPAVADLNGDGYLDVAVNDRANRLHLIDGRTGQALPGWSGGKLLWDAAHLGATFGDATVNSNYGTPVIADVDGDGRPDVVALGTVFINAFDVSGRLLFRQQAATDADHYPEFFFNSPAVGQLDGRGGLELLAVSNGHAPDYPHGEPGQVEIYNLPASPLAPPWPMQRKTAAGQAVQLSTRRDVVPIFVDGAYRAIFGRSASPAELNGWVAQLQTNQITRDQFAHIVASSAEARRDEIDALYQRYLGRLPESTATETAWMVRLAQSSVKDVSLSLIGSPEFAALSGNTLAGEVTRLYQTILGRNPAPAEVNGWAGSGLPLSAIARAFLYSDEALLRDIRTAYAQAFGGAPVPADSQAALLFDLRRGANEEDVNARILLSGGQYVKTQPIAGWLRNLYRDVLNREAAPAEIANWLQAFDANRANLATAAAAIVDSPEGRMQFVREQFVALLGRVASPGEAAALAGYASRPALVATLINSGEYYQKNGGTTTGFVVAVFRDVLDYTLTASSPDVQYWVNQIDGGKQPRSNLTAAALANPAHANQVAIRDIFRYIPDEALGVLRNGHQPPGNPPINPNPGLLNALSADLQGGMSESALLSQVILTSPAYVSRAAYNRGYFHSIGNRYPTPSPV